MLKIIQLILTKIIAPIVIFLVVSGGSISTGKDPTIANVLGVAAAFGKIFITINIGL